MEQGIFVIKRSDTDTLGLTNGLTFPRNSLVFYFDFQKINWQYVINQQYKYIDSCIQNVRDKTNNYILQFKSYPYDYIQSIVNKTNGIKNNGIYIRCSYVVKNSFTLNNTLPDFTLLCSIKLDNKNFWCYDEYNSIIYIGADINSGFGFYIKNSDNILKIFVNGQSYNTQYTVLRQKWYRFFITYSLQQNKISVFIDGQLIKSFSVRKINIVKNQSKVYVGGLQNEQYGYQLSISYGYSIDQFALFDRLLTEQQIEFIYNTKAYL